MNPSPLTALVLAVIAGVTAPAIASAPAHGPAKASASPQTPARTAAKAAAPAHTPAPVGTTLTDAQLALSDQVLLGDIDCELKRRVSLWPMLSRPGHFELRFGKAVYTLVPQETATGAVRLEDAQAGVVWLQIPVKSMLLDARTGQRLANGCLHAAQRHELTDPVSAEGGGLGISELQR